MSNKKFHIRDLLHAICTAVSLIADVIVTFVLSAFDSGALVAVASTDAGIAGVAVLISSVAGVFSFLLSLANVRLLGMVVVVAVDLQREEEEGQRSR